MSGARETRAARSGRPSGAAFGLAFAALAGFPAAVPLAAQDAPIEARVEGIAGSDLYLSAGTDAGVVPGSVLIVLGDDGEDSPGRLQVAEATSSRCRVTFAGDPFPVTRGAILRLRVLADGEGVPPAGIAAGAAAAGGGGTEQAGGAGAGSSSGPRVRGSLGLSFDYRKTVTSWDEFDYEEVDRSFSTPAASLRLGVTDLPGGVEFRTSLRATYRASTDDVVQPQELVRVYSLQVWKDFGAVQASLGRIHNPYEPMSGYFDGAWVHVGRREGFGGGGAAGLRPRREDAAITDSFPKLSVFANYSDRTGPLKYEGALSFTHEAANAPVPLSAGIPAPQLEDHSYFGLTQTLRTGRLLLRHSMAVDRDPTDDAWKVSRFLLGASLPIAGGLTAHARYSLRQPYRVVEPDPIAHRRDRANAGLTYAFGRATVGADVTMNDPNDEVRGTGWTYSGWFQVPETSVLDLGFSGTVSVRDRDGDRLLYVMPGLTRRFGSTFARATYTYYRTEEPAAVFTTHMGDVSVDFPIAARLRGTLAGRIQNGAELDATGVYGSLWWAF